MLFPAITEVQYREMIPHNPGTGKGIVFLTRGQAVLKGQELRIHENGGKIDYLISNGCRNGRSIPACQRKIG